MVRNDRCHAKFGVQRSVLIVLMCHSVVLEVVLCMSCMDEEIQLVSPLFILHLWVSVEFYCVFIFLSLCPTFYISARRFWSVKISQVSVFLVLTSLMLLHMNANESSAMKPWDRIRKWWDCYGGNLGLTYNQIPFNQELSRIPGLKGIFQETVPTKD